MSTEDGIVMPKYDLKDFKITKILNNNVNRKTISVLGKFPSISEDDQALILLEKTSFKEEDFMSGNEDGVKSGFLEDAKLKVEFINNIYGSFNCIPPSNLSELKTTVIYPATKKHIEKYSTHEKYLVQESPDLYKNITLPHLMSEQFSLDWVYNILDHKSEEERIVFEDKDPENGFILLPDLKWDGKTVETLYLLALVHKRNIKSIRNLDESHLPLLKNIREAGCAAIKKHYGVKESQIRAYFHYQPSFYHLHVHFNPVKNEIPGIFCEKSHLLDTVINNIELMPDYYKKATLTFVGYEGDKLLEKFQEENVPRKKIKTDV